MDWVGSGTTVADPILAYFLDSFLRSFQMLIKLIEDKWEFRRNWLNQRRIERNQPILPIQGLNDAPLFAKTLVGTGVGLLKRSDCWRVGN